MAKSASGKWVSRVGASGGGKSYQRRRPSNFLGAVTLIVALGLLTTIYSRYEYQHPATTTTAPQVAPAIGTTWYAALSLQACGERLPFLNPDPNFKGGFKVQATDVVQVSPTSAADAGNRATLKQFAAEFPGLVLTSSELAVPTATGVANPKTTYANGQACPAGSKYAGKKGAVVYAYWRSFGQKTPTLTTDPASIKFSQYLRVSVGFEPKGVTPLAPLQSTVNNMVAAAQVTTSTTTAPVATTTVPATTSTTAPPSGSTTTTTTTKG
ncbi:MAG: hypothetical protein KGI14_03940 [Acidobacteriota bacterium]|nr:hypothetical protein [Acidobacteriota bacterium]